MSNTFLDLWRIIDTCLTMRSLLLISKSWRRTNIFLPSWDKLAECGDPSIKLLYLFFGAWMLHIDDSFYFLEIGLNFSLRHKKFKKIFESYSKYTLDQIQFHLMSSTCTEGFFQILNMISKGFSPAYHLCKLSYLVWFVPWIFC